MRRRTNALLLFTLFTAFALIQTITLPTHAQNPIRTIPIPLVQVAVAPIVQVAVAPTILQLLLYQKTVPDEIKPWFEELAWRVGGVITTCPEANSSNNTNQWQICVTPGLLGLRNTGTQLPITTYPDKYLMDIELQLRNDPNAHELIFKVLLPWAWTDTNKETASLVICALKKNPEDPDNEIIIQARLREIYASNLPFPLERLDLVDLLVITGSQTQAEECNRPL